MHNLTQRQIEILRNLIEEYIETALPVGSETLEKKRNISASPATIRKEKEISVTEGVELKEKVWDYRATQQRLLKEVARSLAEKTKALAIATTDEGDFFCAGYSNILDMPEFFDIDITKNLLSVVDELGYFDSIFSKIENDDDIHILFGEDLGPKLQGPYGSVFAHYKTPKHASGEIGVIGPTRLNYTYVVPTVRYFSNLIQELAEGW